MVHPRGPGDVRPAIPPTPPYRRPTRVGARRRYNQRSRGRRPTPVVRRAARREGGTVLIPARSPVIPDPARHVRTWGPSSRVSVGRTPPNAGVSTPTTPSARGPVARSVARSCPATNTRVSAHATPDSAAPAVCSRRRPVSVVGRPGRWPVVSRRKHETASLRRDDPSSDPGSALIDARRRLTVAYTSARNHATPRRSSKPRPVPYRQAWSPPATVDSRGCGTCWRSQGPFAPIRYPPAQRYAQRFSRAGTHVEPSAIRDLVANAASSSIFCVTAAARASRRRVRTCSSASSPVARGSVRPP